jgi:uncharacterized protein
VIRLPRQPGQKEARIAHLLAGEINIERLAESELPKDAGSSKLGAGERISRLERQVESLDAEMKGLRQQFAEFKKQFE